VNITIISCFRNSCGHIVRYFDQMLALRRLLHERGDHLALLLGYGDSTDGTEQMLFEEASFAIGALLVEVSHGGQHFGSIENAQRFKQLAYVGNTLLSHVDATADVVGIVESDLIWDAETMVRLLDHLDYVPAIAPMVMDGEHSFYDVYAFRMDGQRFTKEPPFLPRRTRPDLVHPVQNNLIRLDSAGSVLFVRAEYARKARLSDGQAIVGYCADIYSYGGSIWLDPTASCAHPPFGGIGRPAGSYARDTQRVRV
jgi:hypothetical protein